MLVTLAAIGAVVCMGISNFAGPLLTRRTSALTVIAVGQAISVTLMIIAVAVFAVAMPGLEFAVIGFACGVWAGIATVFAFRAGQFGKIGIVAVILSLSAIIPVIGGIVGGDRPPAHQWMGIALAATGTALTLLAGNRERSAEGRAAGKVPKLALAMPVGAAAVPAEQPPPVVRDALRRAGRNWMLMAALGAIGFGVFMLVFAKLSERNVLWATLFTRAGMGSIAVVAIVVLGRPLFAPGNRRRQFLPLPFIGLTMALAVLLYGYAAASMMTVASALTAFAPVVTVSLSWIILHEHLTRAQMVGIAITVVGLSLVAV